MVVNFRGVNDYHCGLDRNAKLIMPFYYPTTCLHAKTQNLAFSISIFTYFLHSMLFCCTGSVLQSGKSFSFGVVLMFP